MTLPVPAQGVGDVGPRLGWHFSRGGSDILKTVVILLFEVRTFLFHLVYYFRSTRSWAQRGAVRFLMWRQEE